MNSNTSATARLRFSLSMELPGPSQGDAYEHLESLGINPWEFESIDPVAEETSGRMVTGTFEVTGTPGQVFDVLAAMISLWPSHRDERPQHRC